MFSDPDARYVVRAEMPQAWGPTLTVYLVGGISPAAQFGPDKAAARRLTRDEALGEINALKVLAPDLSLSMEPA